MHRTSYQSSIQNLQPKEYPFITFIHPSPLPTYVPSTATDTSHLTPLPPNLSLTTLPTHSLTLPSSFPFTPILSVAIQSP